jgi:hypothetical protein
VRNRRAATEEHGFQIHVHKPVPLRLRHFGRRLHHLDRGVCKKNVYSAEFFNSRLDHPLGRGGNREVAYKRNGHISRLFDSPASFNRGGLIDIRRNYTHTGGCQQLTRSTPDTVPGARDNCRPIFQIPHASVCSTKLAKHQSKYVVRIPKI